VTWRRLEPRPPRRREGKVEIRYVDQGVGAAGCAVDVAALDHVGGTATAFTPASRRGCGLAAPDIRLPEWPVSRRAPPPSHTQSRTAATASISTSWSS
jgi:hypothetical protein